MRRRGKPIAFTAVAVGLVFFVGAGIASKDWLLKEELPALWEKHRKVTTSCCLEHMDAIISAVESKGRFVTLSVGKNLSVEPGWQFTVARGDEFIGKVQVITVYPDISGARILFTNAGQEIRPGDKAFTIR